MKIAINARLLIKGRKDGISRFTDETLKRITTQHPEHRFLFLFDRKFHPDFIYSENIEPKIVYPQARHPILYDIWFNKRLPKILKKWQADIFVSTDGFLPLNCEISTLSVIHDLNFEHFPQFLPKKDLKYYKKRFPVFAKQATRISTVSQFSKSDIEKTYGIDAKKISVVYNGISEGFKSISEEEKIEIQQKFSSGKPYFIFTGSLHERKNIVRMLQAFEMFKQKRNCDYKLLLVGPKMWWTKDMQQALDTNKFKSDVLLLGSQSEKMLNKLVAAADAMIYVPIFEGFGIPPLEAMQCGVPVLASNIGAVSEISGEAAFLVNPLDVNEIAKGMGKIIEPEQKKTLAEKGFEQIKKYSWQKTADLLWETIEKTINNE